MISLNIIPKKFKKELILKSIFNNIKNILIIISIFFFIYTVVLEASKFILHNHYADTISQTSLVTKNIKNYSDQVDEINKKTQSIIAIQQEYHPLSELIFYLSKNISSEIRLYQLKVDNSGKTLHLTGLAKTRDSLLALKKSIDDNQNFANIVFPTKNLLKKNDIDFEISANITGYEFE
ncbi:MAG: hypothetical protein U9R06_03295 [Patescibacteria group bacterium]|nr:hypothetical protein [Patescibacteria group bacterium]